LFARPALAEGGETIETAVAINILPFVDTGNTFNNDDDYDEACPDGSIGAPDVVYVFTPDEDVIVTISLCDSGYDTKLYVYEGGYTPGAPLACNDNACSDSQGNPFRSRITDLALFAGTSYFIVVDGFGAQSGPYELVVEETMPCEVSCPPAAVLEGEPMCGNGYVDAFNGGCDVAGEPVFSSIACQDEVCGTSGTFLVVGVPRSDTDWYEIELTSAGPLTWTVEAEFDVRLFVLDGNSGCEGISVLGTTEATACSAATIDLDEVAAGVCWLWVGPAALDGVPCGAGYVAAVSCAGSSCPGDIDGDGTVGASDLLAMLSGWGGDDPDVDLNDDGVVDVADLLALLSAWGPC
jgi:hypothetical protein